MTLRVAIVGLGPKGLYALERLLDRAATTGSPAPIAIDVYEPCPTPGAGPNYDPRQPAYLRMNFAAGQIDMWWPTNRSVPHRERTGFVDWSRANDMPVGADDFPSRARVGRYLADGLATVLRHAPPNARVTRRPTTVRAVSPRGNAWRLDTNAGTAAYDEVLVATGHDWSGGSTVFPVDRWLSPARVPAGAIVAVRGFALTFIDAALALTEGRGGTFEPTGHPYSLRYRPSGDEPASIVPFSRTGRPMLAKPGPDLAASIPVLETFAELACAQIDALPAPLDLEAGLLPIIAATAACSLVAARGYPQRSERSPAYVDEIAAWLTAACGGSAPASGLAPADEIERSLSIGAGLSPPDLQWAFGHTWRTLYPSLVARCGADGLAARSWPPFLRLAREMERIAFGPAPINAAKLLSLVGSGRVDLSRVRGDTNGTRTVDVTLDAVLDAPGARGELLGGLVERGAARVPPARRGIEVTDDGTCLGRDGSPSLGLAAVGRPTEDWVIGNDTLSRRLHPEVDRWATRVVQRAATQRRVPEARHALVT
jgi:uncharacterized NAD(P)/FAD-binding protein YdhS